MKIITKKLRAHKQLKTYKVAQGSCATDKRMWVAYEQKPTHGKKHRIKIARYNLSGDLIRVSGAMKLGHANDMTYHDGILYVTHSGSDNVIHRVDAWTLKKKKDIRVKIGKFKKSGYNGIAKTADGFVLRRMGGGLLYVDDKFRAVKAVKCPAPKKRSPQGIAWNDGHVFRAYSDYQSGKNSVIEYTASGKKVKRYALDLKGELESIFFANGKMNCIIYRKYKKDGKMHYEARLIR